VLFSKFYDNFKKKLFDAHIELASLPVYEVRVVGKERCGWLNVQSRLPGHKCKKVGM